MASDLSAVQASLEELLASTKVSALMTEKREVIAVRDDTNLLEAVKLMAAHNVAACPVRSSQAPDGTPWREAFVGFLDTLSIVYYLYDTLEDIEKNGGNAAHLQNDHRVVGVPVSKIMDTATQGPFVPLTPDHTLRDVMLIMGRFGLHRLPVVSGDNVVGIITQQKRSVFSITHDASLKQAIEMIRTQNLSAVPVLGVKQELVGNVSSRDLRNLVTHGGLFSLLHEPVRKFIDAITAAEHEAMNPAIGCKTNHSLQQIMQQLAVSKIHRIYLCDAHDRVLRVVSLSDILNVFVQEDAGYLAASFNLE
ncbi:uncharacterized protein MONBRDRAFT_38237 [Monosiga brevicollis MX1]|uniref:CBS domain-containing protein n=1 Tax=Monosiga brevicollis TaxID=81824 RepID=A9V6M8_MONBE|nr:uncharacterized protein MONBRDRAFT_38237 [Monosiga brevicollis MX1]EDQ86835.1 predicted protein [Monosiga brevicollis MX1]|eukprot:XP_001748380.1 hypothetical protein [Monosiga brevicollis MX1]